MKIILYGSQYGTAKRYAEEFGKRTQTEVKRYDEIDGINCYFTCRQSQPSPLAFQNLL